MGEKRQNCNFCNPNDEMRARTIKRGRDFISLASRPFYRPDHVLVIPTDHYEHMSDVPEDTLGRMMGEAALLETYVDKGYGAIMAQKFQPLRAENSIKMNHVHIHVWPRTWRDEEQGVLIPAPQSFRDFVGPNNGFTQHYIDHTIDGTTTRLRRLHELHDRNRGES